MVQGCLWSGQVPMESGEERRIEEVGAEVEGPE